MARDLEDGSQLEVEALSGAVGPAEPTHAVPTPHHQAIPGVLSLHQTEVDGDRASREAVQCRLMESRRWPSGIPRNVDAKSPRRPRAPEPLDRPTSIARRGKFAEASTGGAGPRSGPLHSKSRGPRNQPACCGVTARPGGPNLVDVDHGASRPAARERRRRARSPVLTPTSGLAGADASGVKGPARSPKLQRTTMDPTWSRRQSWLYRGRSVGVL